MARLRREMERTAELAAELGERPGASAVQAYLEETGRLQQQALQRVDAGLDPSLEALFGLREELRSLAEDRREQLLGALRAAAPRPSLEELDGLQLSSPAGGGEAADDADRRHRLIEALDSWVNALVEVSQQGAAALSGPGRDTPSLDLFMARALGTLVAFALYREHSLTASALYGASEDARDQVQALQERQAQRLQQLQQRADLLDS